MGHPWASFPFILECSFQPLNWMLLWTTLAASAVGVLPLRFGCFFLHVLPSTPPAAKTAPAPTCIYYWGQHGRSVTLSISLYPVSAPSIQLCGNRLEGGETCSLMPVLKVVGLLSCISLG